MKQGAGGEEFAIIPMRQASANPRANRGPVCVRGAGRNRGDPMANGPILVKHVSVSGLGGARTIRRPGRTTVARSPQPRIAILEGKRGEKNRHALAFRAPVISRTNIKKLWMTFFGYWNDQVKQCALLFVL